MIIPVLFNHPPNHRKEFCTKIPFWSTVAVTANIQSPLHTNKFHSDSVHKSYKISLGIQLTKLAIQCCTIIGL